MWKMSNLFSYTKTFSDWNVSLYSSQKFGRSLVTEIIEEFRNSDSSIKFLLIDDYLISANSRDMSILNEMFAYFRHLNVSIIATLHSFDKRFKVVIQQTGIVIVLYSLSTSMFLQNILLNYFHKGTAALVRKIKKCYLSKMSMHSYICLNFTKEAMCGNLFFLSDNVFSPKLGITIQQILNVT